MGFKSDSTLFSISQSGAQFLKIVITRYGPLYCILNYRERFFSCECVFTMTIWPGLIHGNPTIWLVSCLHFDVNHANLLANSITWKRFLCSQITSSTCLKSFPGNCLLMSTSNFVNGIRPYTLIWANFHGWMHRCIANNMMTSSNGNIFRVTGPLCGEFTGPGEFPTQRPVTRSFDVFFDLRLNKRLSKQPWGWWFETLSWSLWRHGNELSFCHSVLRCDTRIQSNNIFKYFFR